MSLKQFFVDTATRYNPNHIQQIIE